MKPYYLDCVVNSESETIRAKEVGRCVGRSLVRFGAKHFPHKVKVEMVAARGGAFNPA